MDKTIQTNESLVALKGLVSAFVNARITLKNKPEVINNITKLLWGCFKSKDFEKACRIVFEKTNGVSFYTAYLKSYYEDNGFILRYNIRKEKLEYFGSLENIQKYEEWLEEVSKARKAKQASLTPESRVKAAYDKRLSSLSKDDLQALAKLVKDKLNSKV